MAELTVTTAGNGDVERYATIHARITLASQTFTPTRPVQAREIFAGRTDQLFDCLSIAQQIGLHGILYGDRGVGKTSIANMVKLFSRPADDEDDSGPVVVKIECTSQDTFPSLIRQIYEAIPVDVLARACGFGSAGDDRIERKNLNELVSSKASFNPKDVAVVISQVKNKVIAILDEFDRLNWEKFDLSSFTELIKISSDKDVDIHFLIVGVGESVDEIIGNHASIVRNLTQIKLAAMTDDEIKQIITTGMKKLDLNVTSKVIQEIVRFSCGYPHYTHLLCLDAACNAIRNERDEVEQPDLDYAIGRALAKAQESVKSAYHHATRTNRQNIYKEVLQACGAAELDEYNTFVPKDIEKPLSLRLKRQMKATQFGSHLINLCKPERGEILISIGERGRARYRFRDPLMRAYVRMAVGRQS